MGTKNRWACMDCPATSENTESSTQHQATWMHTIADVKQEPADVALERSLAAARVSAFISAPSWVRNPQAGAQAQQILALVLDTTSCAARHESPWGSEWVCYREKGHDGVHFSDGNYTWDLTDEELEARHEREIEKSIADHDRMLDTTLEDR